MMSSFLKYFYQYGLVTILVTLSVVFEQTLMLRGLALWVLSYLLLRRVSFKIILVLSFIPDLLSLRPLGSTGLWLSLLLIFLSQIHPKRRIFTWLTFLVGNGILVTLDHGSVNFGFYIVAFVFLILIHITSVTKRIFTVISDENQL